MSSSFSSANQESCTVLLSDSHKNVRTSCWLVNYKEAVITYFRLALSTDWIGAVELVTRNQCELLLKNSDHSQRAPTSTLHPKYILIILSHIVGI